MPKIDPYKVPDSSEPADDPVLSDVLKKYNAGRDYYKQFAKDPWIENRKLYNNERVSVGYVGNADGFVPETYTIIQAQKAHLIGPDLRMVFLPRNQQQRGDTRVLNSLFDFFYDQDHTILKLTYALDDTLIVGNGYLWQCAEKHENVAIPGNKYVPAEDCFFDPNCKNYDELNHHGYGGYRYMTSLASLEDETITNPDYNEDDKESQIRIKKYKDLDKIQTGFSDKNDKTAKELREEMLGGTNKAAKDEVEVIVYFDQKHMRKIVNRSVVIEDVKTPYQRAAKWMTAADDQGQEQRFLLPAIDPFIPVAPFRRHIDGAMWYAKSDIDVIKERQEKLNDVDNQKSDNLDYQLNVQYTLDPAYQHKKDEVVNAPGNVMLLPVGALQEVKRQPIGNEADAEMVRVKDEMRRATGADELVQGASQDSGGALTATEVNAQLSQSGSRFQLNLHLLENEGCRIMAQNMYKIAQIFITQEIAVRTIGPEGVEWKNYNPGEYLGDWDIKVQLKATADRMEEEEKQNAMQFFLLASKLPFVNQELLFKETAGTIFKKEPKMIESLIQPVAPGQGNQERLIQTMAYKDLPPDIQAQMEADAGFQPSPTHQVEMNVLQAATGHMPTGAQTIQEDQSLANEGHTGGSPQKVSVNAGGVPQGGM